MFGIIEIYSFSESYSECQTIAVKKWNYSHTVFFNEKCWSVTVDAISVQSEGKRSPALFRCIGWDNKKICQTARGRSVVVCENKREFAKSVRENWR